MVMAMKQFKSKEKLITGTSYDEVSLIARKQHKKIVNLTNGSRILGRSISIKIKYLFHYFGSILLRNIEKNALSDLNYIMQP